MRLFLLLLCLLPPALSHAATDTRVLRAGDSMLRVEVIDVDDPQRVQMLHRWIREVAEATKMESGRFPLRNAYVRVRQIDSRDPSPAPWGQTRRRGEAGVLLFVRHNAGAEALRDDWTAVHELSHLRHPYLGEGGRWLAEGLASYYQNVLRARAGILGSRDAWERLDAGFRRGEAVGAGPRLDALGRRRGATMRVYWAGAAYWLEADLVLRRTHDTSLDAVLDRYARCCLRGTASVTPEAFAAELDRIADGDSLTTLYRRYAAMRHFPSLDAAYQSLGIKRNGNGLRYSDAADATRLRDAVMLNAGSSMNEHAIPGPRLLRRASSWWAETLASSRDCVRRNKHLARGVASFDMDVRWQGHAGHEEDMLARACRIGPLSFHPQEVIPWLPSTAKSSPVSTLTWPGMPCAMSGRSMYAWCRASSPTAALRTAPGS